MLKKGHFYPMSRAAGGEGVGASVTDTWLPPVQHSLRALLYPLGGGAFWLPHRTTFQPFHPSRLVQEAAHPASKPLPPMMAQTELS